jgi:hypothetical protein
MHVGVDVGIAPGRCARRKPSHARLPRVLPPGAEHSSARWRKPPETYPEPVPHCEVCLGWPECNRRRRADDPLSLVAAATRLRRRGLAARGLETADELARTGFRSIRVQRGAVEAFAPYVRPRGRAARSRGAPLPQCARLRRRARRVRGVRRARRRRANRRHQESQATRELHAPAAFVHARIDPVSLRESLERLATWAADHDGDGDHRVARDFCSAIRPRRVRRCGSLRREGEDLLATARRLALELDRGVLPVQGPRGAGKTIWARMICELVCAGKKVGVTAVSPPRRPQPARARGRAAKEEGPHPAACRRCATRARQPGREERDPARRSAAARAADPGHPS